MARDRVSTDNVAGVASKAAELRRLELLITRRLDGLLRGEFRGIRPGPGTDFAGTREYEAGDDARRIDWNLSARSLAPFIRTTDADRELQTWVVVDQSSSMDFGTVQHEKADVAFAAVAAFGFLNAQQGNKFGVMTAGNGPIRRLGPSSTRTALLATLSRVYDTKVTDDSAPSARASSEEHDLTAALRALERGHLRRGLIVVVSDFLDDGTWAPHLRRLAYHHDVLAVQITDPREAELPAMGMLTLADPETGREIRVQTNSRTLRERYAQAAEERQRTIAATITGAGADHLVLSTAGDWLFDIARFVVRRRTFGRVADPSRDRRLRAAQSGALR
jgi:uncharacterized protein (DUF58 family)